MVLLTDFLHHFDRPTCTELLRKVHGALRDGGRAVTLEFVPNDDRVTPRAGVVRDDHAGNHGLGRCLTFAELESMAAEAGFRKSELHRLAVAPQSVVVSTK